MKIQSEISFNYPYKLQILDVITHLHTEITSPTLKKLVKVFSVQHLQTIGLVSATQLK